MFRLIKLAFYALVGYALYELYQGMMQGQSSGDQAFGGDLGNALNRGDEGRMGALTGEGVGHIEQTLDATGASIPHRVGRGVTRS